MPSLARGDGHPSRAAVADSLVRPTRDHRAGSPQTLAQGTHVPLLTLLRVGFTKPPQSPAALVVSYTTVSPLPSSHGRRAVCFLWHCPAGHPGSALPTTLPCGARTFLTGPRRPGATVRPTHPEKAYCPGRVAWIGRPAAEWLPWRRAEAGGVSSRIVGRIHRRSQWFRQLEETLARLGRARRLAALAAGCAAGRPLGSHENLQLEVGTPLVAPETINWSGTGL